MTTMNLYFRRAWDDITSDPLTEDWGTSTYYFETGQNGKVFRQLEVYANGKRLKYTSEHLQDKFGGLSVVPLDLAEFGEFQITKNEFEEAWNR